MPLSRHRHRYKDEVATIYINRGGPKRARDRDGKTEKDWRGERGSRRARGLVSARVVVVLFPALM